MSGSRTINCN